VPIYEIRCFECGSTVEVLAPVDTLPECPACGSGRTEKLLTATSPLSGHSKKPVPGPGDHGCCGTRPDQAGCAGPGSCCGKNVNT
jgi:putative FmdB family regulatory protein